jgi:hypothetical protein
MWSLSVTVGIKPSSLVLDIRTIDAPAMDSRTYTRLSNPGILELPT